MNKPLDAFGFWSEARCVMDGSEVLWNFHNSSPFSSGSTSTCIGTLSVNDLPALPSITVVPNPAIDRITIALPPELGVGASVEVFSITGQRMFRQEHVPTTLHMDISGWARGAYLYEVTYRDGQKSRGRLLAQ